MRHTALNALLRLREYALEKEEQKLGERSREEHLKLNECDNSRGELHRSYQHTVTDANAFDYLRRDKCVREAGNRHINDMRQLALVQRAKQAQIETTLQAKRRAEMIEKVIQKRDQEDRQAEEDRERKRMDEISQNLFLYHRDKAI